MYAIESCAGDAEIAVRDSSLLTMDVFRQKEDNVGQLNSRLTSQLEQLLSTLFLSKTDDQVAYWTTIRGFLCGSYFMDAAV